MTQCHHPINRWKGRNYLDGLDLSGQNGRLTEQFAFSELRRISEERLKADEEDN